MGIEGTYLNTVKAIYDKPTANIILNGEKLKSIPPKIRNKTSLSTCTTSIKHSSWTLATAIREVKEIKGIQIRKEEVKHRLQMT